MSTRSIIRFAEREEGVSFSEHPEEVEVQIYKHFDGYPSGVGVRLAEFLDEFKVVNGIGQNTYKVANGIGCLAAQLVADWKDGPGDVYLEKFSDNRGDLEYIYYVWATEGKGIWISIFDTGYGREDKCLFVGKPEKLIEKYEEND